MTNDTEPERYRILVVDDNPSIHQDIKKILVSDTTVSPLDLIEAEMFGTPQKTAVGATFVVDSAFQGQEGLQKLEQAVDTGDPYVLAFVDVRMPPGWDGIETIAHLWAKDPALQVVICTAYSDHSWEEIIETLGGNDSMLVLKKPFDNIEVLQITHAMARKWRLNHQLREHIDHLETSVRRRTEQLQRINEQLRAEVEQRLVMEANLERLATHDPLTGLPNRILLRDRLERAFARAHRFGHFVGLVLLDLDHFKEINDSLGHAAGDELLRLVSARFQQTVRSCDTVARMGGDEFVIVLDQLASPSAADAVVRRIVEALREPFVMGSHSICVTASIGLSSYPTDCDDLETLLKFADMAMYRVKEEGRNGHSRYIPGMSVGPAGKLALREELVTALQQEQFRLWYQPLYSLPSGRLAGVEALLRWEHPQRGLVNPMDFVPTAEESGLIIPLGDWVLRTSCRQFRQWQMTGLHLGMLAVNLSVKQLADDNLVQNIDSILKETGLCAECLELELTESAAVRDPERARKTLTSLHDLGVSIVIDDFGAGHSTLTRLKSLPIRALKIDRFFLKNVINDPRDASIVKAIIGLAHSLRLEVVAEGVETQEQLDFLLRLDWQLPPTLLCERVQGWLFSKAVPAAEIPDLLTTHPAFGNQEKLGSGQHSDHPTTSTAERMGEAE